MRRALTLALLAFWTASAHAQQPGQAPKPEISSHEQAVTELFHLMDLETAMVSSATAMIDSQIQANPQIAPYRDVLIQWSSKYLTWDNMASPLVKIYMEAFTEAETREMIAFYRTPTGRKALTKLPELYQKGAAVGAEVGQAHQDELKTMILERKAQLEAAAAATEEPEDRPDGEPEGR